MPATILVCAARDLLAEPACANPEVPPPPSPWLPTLLRPAAGEAGRLALGPRAWEMGDRILKLAESKLSLSYEIHASGSMEFGGGRGAKDTVILWALLEFSPK